ncbi:hypothetical protein IF1G_09697 [Cordyceps javanica]|uniref:Uncharacterized protein n=1 Tax=Cordyceps javanica TaxID=43265 RepID=A0A545UQ89_9HYPO|nr:hypothetical protein IF1G_09697 [Cordyceps javanica]TQW03585.1 hypothetical protein IF2G_08883 [Cordyceps javanica]
MQHRVYLSISLGAPRDHHSIFIENEPGGPGTVLQATGNIQTGMTFEVKTNNRPEASPEFLKREYLGWVSAEDLHRVESVCASVPPPKKQFDGPRRLYPGQPLRRCQEWTQEAIDALVTGGILHTTEQG